MRMLVMLHCLCDLTAPVYPVHTALEYCCKHTRGHKLSTFQQDLHISQLTATFDARVEKTVLVLLLSRFETIVAIAVLLILVPFCVLVGVAAFLVLNRAH